jgi:tape measure domain-containing protein
MARNIGTFTAAGVKLEVATNAIKGIANLAAISGSSAEQASTAMYQLSQALATGTLKLIDWNSVVNAGMGGKVFQDALMETARVHGVAIDKIVKDAGSFRNSLQEGWLTSAVLTETLSKFTGDLTDQQLKAMGYTEDQIKGILKMGKVAQDAATKVKTVSQLIGTLQEAAGSGWAATWQLIFGDFEEAREMFTEVNDTFSGFIKASADARNSVLKDWKELGGRKVAIEGITLAFNLLMEILNPIRLAFRDIFPRKTGQDLFNITVAIRDFFSAARLGEDTMTNLRRTFAGVFAIFGIGFDIIKQVARVLFELFGMASGGASSFLEITANIGDFFVALRKAINEGQGLVKFFDGVRNVLAVPVKLLVAFSKALTTLFDGFDADEAAGEVVNFVSKLGPLGVLADFIAYAWERVAAVFGKIWAAMAPLAAKFTEWFHEIESVVGELDFDKILKAVNTGLFLSLVIMLRNALSGRGGFVSALSQLTSVLTAMQHALQAATLLQIAIAIGVLAVSVAVLSKIDAEALATSLSALAIMFTQLVSAMAVLQLIPGVGAIRIYAIAASMIVLAAAIGVLAISVKALSKLSWEELAKGLTGVAALLVAISVAANVLPAGAGLISVGLGLLVLSAGIKILASAVNDLAGLSWEEMARGLTAVGGLLASLSLFARFTQASALGLLSGAGLVLLAASIKILASAMKDLVGLSWEEIARGLVAMAGGLAIMAVALNLIPPHSALGATGVLILAASIGILADGLQKMGGMSWGEIGKGLTVLAVGLTLVAAALVLIPPYAPLSAAGVLIVAVAVGVLADALKKMGAMSWTEIAKGLIVLAGSLGIITVALTALPIALPGALALLVVAGALAILTPILAVLGKMSWGEIVKGLVTLAAAFVVIGVAGALIGPVVPALLGLGLAITLLGAGLALAGVGVFFLATGLTALSVAGAAGAAALVAVISAVIGLIPMMAEQIGVALLVVIKILQAAVPQIVALLLDILVQLLEGIVRLSPPIENALIALVFLILNVLERAIPRMVLAGVRIIIGILTGIRDNIGQVIKVAGQVIEAYLNGIGKALPGIIQAGVNLILSFIKGMTNAINKNSKAMGEAGADLAIAIINGMVNGLRGAGGRVAAAARDVARNALAAAMDFLGISSPSKEFEKVGRWSSEGMAIGLKRYSVTVEKAAEGVARDALTTVRKSISTMHKMVENDLELTPTITPVLDLTNVKRTAETLPGMLSTKPIQPVATYTSAAQASDGIDRNRQTILDLADNLDRGTQITYVQNNTSPKALTPAEIYRQTRNQLSTAKGGLPA